MLSITSKAEKLKAKKEANENVMDTKDDKPTEDAKPEKPDEPEADFEMISNPARVVPAQVTLITVLHSCL